VLYDLDAAKAWMKMRWLKLQMPEEKLRCFLSGTTTIIFLEEDINLAGLLKEDITERHSLRWYEYTKTTRL
jgi:hypothetical protein